MCMQSLACTFSLQVIMRTHFNRFEKEKKRSVEEVWEIKFFWANEIQCSEEDIRRVTYNAMHPEMKKLQEFKKAS